MRSGRSIRVGIALAAAAATVVALAGCAPLDQKRVLADVKQAVEAADPDLSAVDVEAGKDGFANVLQIAVAIPEDTIDTARVRALLAAAVDVRGTSAYTLLRFEVSSPDFHGDLLDLGPAAEELGIDDGDAPMIADDVSTIKKALD